LFQIRHLLDPILLLQLRIEKGIKSELKEIISLDRVGRVLGRALFDSGFKTRESLYLASVDDISKTPHSLITPSFAKKIKEQLKEFES
jgi:replicative superfamily II helicase